MHEPQKTTSPLERGGEKMPYVIHDIKKLGCPHVVIMSFELPYLDWCRFEQSDLYHSLTEYLEGLKKQEIQIPQPEQGD